MLLGGAITFAYLLHWVKSYPDDWDSKNIDYLLWKHDLNHNVNLEHMTEAVGHDPDRESFVKGMTKDQLQARFGEIRPLNQALPYFQWCVENSGRKGSDVVMLRDTELAVVLDKGKAVEIFRVKGC
jgi:hypothetical protein